MSSNKKLYKKAISTFGADSQIDKTIEECAELIVALQQYKRHKRIEKLKTVAAEKIAGIEIMCRQMRVLFPGVLEIKKTKAEALEQMINNTLNMWERENQ